MDGLEMFEVWKRVFDMVKEDRGVEFTELINAIIAQKLADEREKCAVIAEGDSQYYGGRIAKKIRREQ